MVASRVRSGLARLTLAALVAGTLATSAAAPASAVTYYTSGTVGAVEIPTTVGRGTMADLTFGARYAWRAPAYTGYTQIIDVAYTVYRWNRTSATWSYFSGASGSRSVAVGTAGATLPSWTAPVLPAEYFRVDVTVRWKLTNGFVIGTRLFDYNVAADYQCGGTGCTIGPGGYILLW